MTRRQTPLLAAALLASVALALPAAPAFAQTAANGGASTAVEREPATIAVTGEGEAAVAPDMAIVTLTVLRDGETAREALDESNAAMDEVLAAMREEGVAERDLQTSGFGINPRYVYPDGDGEPREPRIAGYEVSNTLTVRLRDLDRLGAVLDSSVTLGVNQGGNIVFTNDDPTETLAEARRDAVADARARAETLSEAAGVSLGRVLRIDETTRRPEPIPMARMEMARAMAADAAVPVAAGENTYRISVTISWELEEAGSE
jgi:uncharacterized protein